MSFLEYLQEPYFCDDCNTWHMNLHDVGDDGTIYQGDQDGNWEPSDYPLPSDDELRAAWLNYLEWVVRTGLDPLSECSRVEKEKVTEKWTFFLSSSLVGLVVVRGRQSKQKGIPTPREFPQHVIDYLELDLTRSPATIAGGQTAEELQAILEKPNSLKPWPHKSVAGFYLLTCFIDRWEDVVPTKKQIRKSAKIALESMLKTRELQEDDINW